MKELYFYFEDRHYRVIANKVFALNDAHHDRVEIHISWIFNNKPQIFCKFIDEKSWTMTGINDLFFDLKTIEEELVKIDYKEKNET